MRTYTDTDGCAEWTATTLPDGRYGVIDGRTLQVYANRDAMLDGEPPEELRDL